MKTQILRFLICGGSAALTDFITYYAFLTIISYSPAKAMSFICGAIVAYFTNKYYTFEQLKKSYKEAGRFTALYFITFFVNVASNKLALMMLPDYVTLCFLFATGVTMVCNFIGQKWFVFRLGV